jgi:hypothetical protein
MPPVFPQMQRHTVGAGLLYFYRRLDRVRETGATGLPQSSHMIYIYPKQYIFLIH